MTKILNAKNFILLVSAFAMIRCGGGSAATPSAPAPVSIGSSEAYSLAATASNVVSIDLGSTCQVGSAAYQNEICTSVTVCKSGTSSCTTINNVLIDTGSYGLRLFKTTGLTGLGLPAVASPGGNPLYNCVTYLDNSGQWGPVVSAKVQLGGTTTSSAVPIEIIDKTDQTPAGDCADPSITLDASATAAGFNGIIGVGLFKEDCGASCVSTTNNNRYYSCASGTCSPSRAPLASQVTNPIAAMPSGYNNGIILNIPNVSSLGAASLSGQMILGVGSQTNNTPVTSEELVSDSDGLISTTYNGTTYTTAFIDSGSNALYFPGAFSLCSDGTFFCLGASVYQNLSATMIGQNSQSRAVAFQIYDTSTLIGGSNNGGNNRVFNNFAGSDGGAPHYFDWGLPIFLGRRVYIGLDAASATFNQTINGTVTPQVWTGPYYGF